MLSEDGYLTLCGKVIALAICDLDSGYVESESDLSAAAFLEAAGIPLDTVPALAARIREGEHHNLSRRTPIKRKSSRKAA